MLPPKVVQARDQAIAQIRRLMGHAGEVRRLEASRETFSSPGAEIRLVEETAKIAGSESVFKRISDSKTVGALLDCTSELRFARVFVALRFEVEFLPPGSVPRPDLRVSRGGSSAYVEIRRIRPPHPERRPAALQQPHDVPYSGNEEVRKVEDELRGKFRQVRAVAGSNSVIAIWSDQDFVDEETFERAVANIRRSQEDPDNPMRIPNELVFCIFGRFWKDCGTGRWFYCNALRELTEPFRTWATELGHAHPD